MKPEGNYLEINRRSWNNRVDLHVASDFYDQKSFLEGKSTLNDIEMKILGNVSGKSILHLQCHFGQDTISLARLGASVTGVDLSDKAVETASSLAKQLDADAQFICCDIYSLAEHLDKQFDVVFTSYGTIGWLPDLQKWANIIHRFLKPGGRFVFAEFHPVVWIFDNKFREIQYTYFKSDAIVEVFNGTYANRQAEIELQDVSWNHSLSEVIGSLLNAGLLLTSFDEYDYSPYNCFDETREVEPGKFRIKHLDNKIPMVYTLSAVKQ
ncbi:MAG TPA: class I SAM-dependent methyltransferase [Flavobacterium sp.]|jgi:SAM-dependent methyltransferase